MITEQNESQAQSAPGNLQSPAPSEGQNETPESGRHRRRRRRRNKGQTKPQASAAQQRQTSSQNAPAPSASPQKPKQSKRFFPKAANGNATFNGNGRALNAGNVRMQNGNSAGRRKGKQRRQQTFVGPMDHSYRMPNGNVAEGSSPSGEFRGVPHSGFYAEEDLYGAPTPVAVRENAPTRIYCFIEDLFFLAKIQEVAKKLGIKVAFVKADKESLTRLTEGGEESRPSLIIFDLNNANAKPLTVIPKLRAKLKRGTSIIGFLSHLQGDLKVKAIDAGCDMVMPRSAFSQNLPNLLRRHGLEEEEVEALHV